jgi:nitrogen fixation/metabolism regulation signal transduction histidine kinase
MQSVLVELNNNIGKEEKLLPEQKDFITSLLIKFSNVFYSDINLYDSNGKLYATSRPEVFNKGFVGNLMNSDAYYNITYQYKPEVVLEEHIGELKYLSAYVPYYNAKGKVIAYLNLPYFTRQNNLTREVSSFAITLVNIYLILILLAMSITFFITNGLTRPLLMLQRKFREIELGKKNEPIVYKRMDEIGSLVSEYNRMLEELSSSAEILAKSEREIAWREMAKQIAHEIKNPLTPMKLSVQHLLRSYNDKTPGWETLVEKMGKTLIEQIDALSTIASEFSLFARLPSPVIERINLVEKAQSIVQLYKQSDNVNIVFENHNIDEIYVNADKEQMLRVLTNLVKNAIQAIPIGKEGLVKVETLNYSSLAIVKISDNGTGITDEVQKKLFNPNFTTKSSGMGLGLAMVKNMVEGMGGKIQYVTKAGEGTTFFVELPCVD